MPQRLVPGVKYARPSKRTVISPFRPFDDGTHANPRALPFQVTAPASKVSYSPRLSERRCVCCETDRCLVRLSSNCLNKVSRPNIWCILRLMPLFLRSILGRGGVVIGHDRCFFKTADVAHVEYIVPPKVLGASRQRSTHPDERRKGRTGRAIGIQARNRNRPVGRRPALYPRLGV